MVRFRDDLSRKSDGAMSRTELMESDDEEDERTAELMKEAADLIGDGRGRGMESPDTSGTDSPSDFIKDLKEKMIARYFSSFHGAYKTSTFFSLTA